MKMVILDAGTLGEDVKLDCFTELGELTVYENTPVGKVYERLCGAQVAIINKIKLNSTNLPDSIRLICVAATGYDNIDTAFCKARGIALCNVPAYSTESVAQLTLSMALSLMGHLKEYRDFVHSGAYSAGGLANRLTPVWHEIRGCKWGIIGGGNIGRRVAVLAKAFGCEVAIYRRKVDPEFPTVDLATLLKSSDIISLHLPLTEETAGLIGQDEIQLMKDGVILINVARGGVTDEAALCAAVERGKIGGLGVDVYTAEPLPTDHPYQRLLSYPNVILTPHTAWGSYEARERCIVSMAENIRAFVAGQKHNRIV